MQDHAEQDHVESGRQRWLGQEAPATVVIRSPGSAAG
jgi:hypothetical protein